MTGFVNFQSDAQRVWELLQQANGTIAFDIGANGGLVSRTFATKFETVVACEPARESYAYLVERAPGNVRPLNVAVSDHVGFVTLRETTLTERWGELFTDDTLLWGDHLGERTVPTTTLDVLSETYGYPSFIKIDTEGHEVEILKGGPDTFLSDPAFIIECHSKDKGEQVREMLEGIGIEHICYHHERYAVDSDAYWGHYWVTSITDRFREGA